MVEESRDMGSHDPDRMKKNKKKKKKKKKKTTTTRRDSDLGISAEAGAAAAEDVQLEGIIGGENMDMIYLLDRSSKQVFDSEKRDEKGERERVGTWDEDSGQIIFFEPRAEKSKEARGFPWMCDEGDHCETSKEAYRDICFFIDFIAKSIGRKTSKVRLYDPFYCAGSVTKNLGLLGYKKVINAPRDFYRDVEEGTVPEHDILITNPPYSGENIQKLFQFLMTKTETPFLLLMPNYVYLKDYFATFESVTKPFYIVPKKRYTYWAPRGLREKKHTHTNADLGERTSPFVSFWYLGLGKLRDRACQAWHLQVALTEMGKQLDLAQSIRLLPDHAKDSFDKSRKRSRSKAKASPQNSKQARRSL